MTLRFIPLVAGFLPIIAINLAYWIAVNDGDVARCVPYLDGCTSISSVGRVEPSKYVFRAIMLPESVVMMIYWLLCYQWLRVFGGDSLRTRWILICGLLSSACLILHVTFLGSEGDFYRLMRRIGTTSYFVFGYLAQAFMVGKLYQLKKAANITKIPMLSWQLAICVILLAVGLLNIPVSEFLENKDEWQNRIAWNFAMLTHLYYIATYFAWRETNYLVKFAIGVTKPTP